MENKPGVERTYAVVTGYDIPGHDLPSGGQPFTKRCLGADTNYQYEGKSGFAAWQAMCDDTPGCVAATAATSPDGCTYLKSAGGRDVMQPNPDFAVSTSALPPQKPCIFVNLGAACTTDQFVDQPICCGGNHVKCDNGICASTLPH